MTPERKKVVQAKMHSLANDGKCMFFDLGVNAPYWCKTCPIVNGCHDMDERGIDRLAERKRLAKELIIDMMIEGRL